MISNQNIAELLSCYDFTANDDFCNSVRRYMELLLRWNKRISLTTVTDPIEIVKFHFGESLFALSAVPIGDGRLADVGSGAGFPGLPLAMARPDLHVSLIESNTKKATFLSETVRELGLSNVVVFRGRTDDFPIDPISFDIITGRAIGRHEELLRWAGNRLSKGGKLVLWLGESDAMAISNQKAWEWAHPAHIPESQRRVILIGTPSSRRLL